MVGKSGSISGVSFVEPIHHRFYFPPTCIQMWGRGYPLLGKLVTWLTRYIKFNYFSVNDHCFRIHCPTS